ncbi:class I SAM-dependent methyltransferase [Halarcobacter ebronensis]|uniref:SAM-dependent methyltransferase n=1 Tax=Halarcobacter ebronensis TaxID=1462615 RepID=A0A4Q1AQS2_9BACT|nr:class I SAM-dependent methyltransferase [Halarcobacter ebronensis]QKF83316.1 SAM-dependent methyltransferase [Halarcobacter ebronensis]RXK05878.1 SAM-dependent methyltransferase [Halarcobacter ebronensis]
MGKLLNIITKLHKSTQRDYLERMNREKILCMKKAKEFEYDFWDGDRKYGYGGYKYDGRWNIIAKELIEEYNLHDGCKILDVGCGKGFLLYEFKKLLPNSNIVGFDVSNYSIENAKEEVKNFLYNYRAEDKYSFVDNEFDLVISINTLHNLKIYEFKQAIQEIERVGKNKYVLVEGYRNDAELFNLECWALTCESFFRPDEWVWLYDEYGYTGDYEFIYFE